jgi:hypothetical protein
MSLALIALLLYLQLKTNISMNCEPSLELQEKFLLKQEQLVNSTYNRVLEYYKEYASLNTQIIDLRKIFFIALQGIDLSLRNCDSVSPDPIYLPVSNELLQELLGKYPELKPSKVVTGKGDCLWVLKKDAYALPIRSIDDSLLILQNLQLENLTGLNTAETGTMIEILQKIFHTYALELCYHRPEKYTPEVFLKKI